MGVRAHCKFDASFSIFGRCAGKWALFPRPQGTIPQKIIVIFEVVVFQFMTGSGPPPHFFCLRHCTRDCRERLLCPHTETLIKFASWSNNHFGSQLFTIKSWTPHLLAMKNRIKWDISPPQGLGDLCPILPSPQTVSGTFGPWMLVEREFSRRVLESLCCCTTPNVDLDQRRPYKMLAKSWQIVHSSIWTIDQCLMATWHHAMPDLVRMLIAPYK